MNETIHNTINTLVPRAGTSGVVSDQAQQPPVIQTGPGRLNENLEVLAGALASTGRFFQSGGRLVTLHHVHRSGTTIQEVSANSLLRELDSLVIWQRIDKRSGEWVRCETPIKHCKLMLGPDRHQYLQPLLGVARQPYLRPNGSLCARAGYDGSTGLFGDFDEGAFDVPTDPTRTDAEAALECLLGLVSEFPFATEHDRSAALSALFTAAVRPSLEAAPMFHVRAPQFGSGKSYLCALITAFASANRGALIAFPTSDEECTKVLISELKRSPAVIEFDNLVTDILPYKSLCSALTAQYLNGRELGQSKMVQVGTKSLVLSSGNNVGPVRDMARRCVTITLDAAHDTPAMRSYTRPNLVEDVLGDRARYVSAALTIVRAWICAGRPNTTCQPLAGFGGWGAWCRQPLLWLGLPDPAKPVFDAMAHDPDRDMLGRLLRAVSAAFGDAPVMVRNLVERATELDQHAEALRDALHDVAGERGMLNVKRLGHWIAAHASQQVDGLKLVKQTTVRNAVCWKVAGVVSQQATATVPTPEPIRAVLSGAGSRQEFVASDESVLSVSSAVETIGVETDAGPAINDFVEESIEFNYEDSLVDDHMPGHADIELIEVE